MLVLATNLYMVFYGRMLMTDVPLTLCFWLVLSGMYEALLGDKKAWVIAGIGLGLSVLAKGPVGLILVGTLAAWTYWKQPSQRTEILRGGAIVLALTVIIMSVWYVPCYLANRDTFVQKFLIEQNLNRFQGGDAAHLVKPAILGPIYYVILLLVGFAPWWWYLRESWPKFLDRTPRTDHLRLLSRWAIVVIGFFTISAAKLPHYVLPALPALAVLVGVNLFAGSRSGDEHVIDALQPDILKRPALLSLVFFVLANVGLISWDGSSGNRDLHNMVRSVKGQQLAVFQLTRRTADLGTGGTKLMDTSHPSIAFYLDAPYTEAETWEELDRSPAKWVLTRPDRITDGDATLHRLVIHEKSDHYVLFERTDR